jgi:hypoxanthine phosphoribosyltransferase
MPNLPKLADALPVSDRLFDLAYIQPQITRLAAEIDRDYAGDRPLYLTIMNGGMLFSSLLALQLKTDVEFDYLHATRYRGETFGGGGCTGCENPRCPCSGGACC